MTERSRRSFLKSATITGAVAGAALLPAGSAAAAALPHTRPQAEPHDQPLAGPAAKGPIVAYVKNAATGEIAVMSGEREVVHVDARLADRLSRLALQAPSA